MTGAIRFLLNDREVNADCDPGEAALDFLRRQARLTSVKAGCREGSCGACNVLLGAARPDSPPRYRAVNSCLLPMAAVAGHHLITVEGLNTAQLTPVQQALLDQGAIQCGFCTPGLVIALTGYLLNADLERPTEILEALDGNLCRCTGYAGIRRAAEALNRHFRHIRAKLPAPRRRLTRLIELGVLPDWFAGAAGRLAALRPTAQQPPGRSSTPPDQALLVAGGTDLFSHVGVDPTDVNPTGINPTNVNQETSAPRHRGLWLAEQQSAWRGIELRDGNCHIGAATTMEELLESPLLAEHIPAAHYFISHIAATPVRDRATVAGNLVNASPIADLGVWLLALGTELLLQGPDGHRRLPLTEFFVGYKRVAMAAGEVITAVEFPLPSGEILFNFEKVGHRTYGDIASVNSAIHLQRAGDRIEQLSISAGGVAAVPLLLTDTCHWLQGRTLDTDNVRRAADLAMREVHPVDDIRGSADYKRLLLRQLLRAHFLTLAPDRVQAAGLLE